MREESEQIDTTNDSALPAEFSFENRAVRTVLRGGEPWFVAKDVCHILEITNHRDAIAQLEEDEKGVGSSDTLGGRQELGVVNESGLYNLIFRSKKPAAKRFRKWVTQEVLPAIRRIGRYERRPDDQSPSFEALRSDPSENAVETARLLCLKVREVDVRWQRYLKNLFAVRDIIANANCLADDFTAATPTRAQDQSISRDTLRQEDLHSDLSESAIETAKLLSLKVQELEVRWVRNLGDLFDLYTAVVQSKTLADTFTAAAPTLRR